MSNRTRSNTVFTDFFQKIQFGSRAQMIGVAVVFGALGAILLTVSHAATPAASVEPESGTVSATASVVSDSTASGNGAVKFGAAGGGGSCASNVINDVGGPDPWGGCWPGPTTTGSSGTLTPSGSIDVTQDNTVIQNLRVTGNITVEAKNVTIRNVQVVSGASGTAIAVNGYNFPGSSLTISHVTVTCSDAGGTTGIEADSNGSAGAVRLTVDHVNVSQCENGFDADENFTITDSYIHDLANTSDSHTDGIQSSMSNNFDVEHNLIYSMKNGSPAPDPNINNGDWTTSAMINAPGGSNGLFQHNLVAGGAYTYYCVRSGVTNQRTLNNLFSKKYGPSVGAFGPTADCGVTGNTFTGNQYVDPGQAPSGTVPTG
jgi:hypothetical protein